MGREAWEEHELPPNIGQHSALAVKVLVGFAYPVVRVLHRATADGFEHLPETGAYLLVGNHPACTGTGEFMSLAALWAKQFGGSRRLTGFVHAAAYRFPILHWMFMQISAIPSTYTAAERALASSCPIAVFPGGDHEAMRPFWKQGTDFNGRQGFSKIARNAGVPIVPMRIRGNSAPALYRSTLLAWLFAWPRALGIKRYCITVLGVVGTALVLALVPLAWPWRLLAAYAWLASPFTLLSWVPTKVHIRFGKPLDASASVADVEHAIDAL